MTDKKYITLQIKCAYCDKEFTNRPEITSPDAEGTTETSLPCLYCGETVKVTVPATIEPKPSIVMKSAKS